MPSKYLFLENTNRNLSVWNNLPTLSQSSRECYISVSSAKLIFEDVPLFYAVKLKIDLPVMNYASSSNTNFARLRLSLLNNCIWSAWISSNTLFSVVPSEVMLFVPCDNIAITGILLEEDA